MFDGFTKFDKWQVFITCDGAIELQNVIWALLK